MSNYIIIMSNYIILFLIIIFFIIFFYVINKYIISMYNKVDNFANNYIEEFINDSKNNIK
jgi:F0F1-type ATP synthase membrane subunit b/b'